MKNKECSAEQYLLAHFNDEYMKVDSKMAHLFGLEKACFLSEILYKYKFWKSEKKIGVDGFFFITSEKIEERTAISRTKQWRIAKKLEEIGVITTKVKGYPSVKYFKVNFEMLEKLYILDLDMARQFKKDCQVFHPRTPTPGVSPSNTSSNNLSNIPLEGYSIDYPGEIIGEIVATSEDNSYNHNIDDDICGHKNIQEEEEVILSVPTTYDNTSVCSMIRWFGKYGDDFLKSNIFGGMSDYERLSDIYGKVCKEGKNIPVSEKTVALLHKMKKTYIYKYGEPEEQKVETVKYFNRSK